MAYTWHMTTQDLLKKLIARGVTPIEIAAVLRCEPGTVRRWENGTRSPHNEGAVKEKLARMLAQCQRNQRPAPQKQSPAG